MDLSSDYNANKEYFSRLAAENEDSNRAGAWGGVNQDFRYRELIDTELFYGSSILEIGCGTGGFLRYMLDHDILGNGSYCGIDIVEKMQAVNQKNYPKHRFLTMDILNQSLDETFDITVFCGVFNTKTANGGTYMRELLKRGFERCSRLMSFNFISSYVNFTEGSMEYHNPAEIMEYCIQNFSTDVKMHHHYAKCDVSCKVYKHQ